VLQIQSFGVYYNENRLDLGIQFSYQSLLRVYFGYDYETKNNYQKSQITISPRDKGRIFNAPLIHLLLSLYFLVGMVQRMVWFDNEKSMSKNCFSNLEFYFLEFFV